MQRSEINHIYVFQTTFFDRRTFGSFLNTLICVENLVINSYEIQIIEVKGRW